MHFSSARRRMLAALAAIGVTGLLPSIARAQDDADTSDTGTTVPCTYSESSDTFADPQNNFSVTATSATFAFVAHIKAIGDNITLYAEEAQGGIANEGLALVKGVLRRPNTDVAPTVESISFETPLTALSQDGQYYGIVGMSHEQNVPVGLAFFQDDKEIGEFELKKSEFDPKSREVAFTGDAASQLYGRLLDPKPFRAALYAGGTAYSEITTTPGAFAEFVNSTLISKMDDVAAEDEDSPCIADDSNSGGLIYDPSASYGCFLTTACCNVVGLADDCWELRTLRQFRDGWMSGFDVGRADITRYYRDAPAVADALMATPAGRARLLALYWSAIVPSALLIRAGLNRQAYRVYRRMMLELLPA